MMGNGRVVIDMVAVFAARRWRPQVPTSGEECKVELERIYSLSPCPFSQRLGFPFVKASAVLPSPDVCISHERTGDGTVRYISESELVMLYTQRIPLTSVYLDGKRSDNKTSGGTLSYERSDSLSCSLLIQVEVWNEVNCMATTTIHDVHCNGGQHETLESLIYAP